MIDQTNPQTSESSRQLLVFEVNQLKYAFPVEVIVNILPMASLSSLPGAPTILHGFLNLGGAAIPVLRLTRLLDVPDVRIGPYTPLIILRHGEALLGLLVSKIHRIAPASQCETVTLPEHGLAKHGVNLNGEIVAVLSMEALFLEQERERILRLQELEQRRLSELEDVNA